MKTLLVMVVFAAGFARANVERIMSVSEVGRFVINDTLVIFDLDNTIFEAKNYKCHANRYYEKVREYQKAPADQLVELKSDVYKWWEKSQHQCDVKFVEENTGNVLSDLQKKGFTVMALTSRGESMHRDTFKQLRSLGVSFSTTAISGSRCETIHGFEGKAKFCSGIVFTSPDHSKGDVLRAYFSKFNYLPQRIVFVDDLRGNLDSIENEFPDIAFLGLYYPLVEIRTKI